MLPRQLRACMIIIGVRITGAHARAAFDNDLVASLNELVSGGGQQCNTMLLSLDFFGNANDHSCILANFIAAGILNFVQGFWHS
jgi:hypothetical protein